MSNLNLLRKVIGSHFVSHSARANPAALPVFFRQSSKFLSTEGIKQPTADFVLDPSKNRGLVYGKLLGFTRNVLKTDIVGFFEGCNLSLDDVKVEYTRNFIPISMMVQFSSQQAFDSAARAMGRKGPMYRLSRADRSQWDLLSPYNGKTVLLQGLPRHALIDDVERFLSGCDYDASSINMFLRQNIPEATKLATVLFPSPTQAMHAYFTKNRGFCLNNQVSVRVLQ